tara:strand:+ start:13379 stop:13855 length:477 start_codon:yes stop_codon:yes gene_type:complete
MMSKKDMEREICNLLDDYVVVIDEDRLEEWPDFFLEDAQYRILSRENQELGLSAPITYYYSRAMLQDRVTALRDALTYGAVYMRHIVSPPRIRMQDDGDIKVSSNVAIYQSTEEGVTRLFVVGRYEDVVVLTDDGPRFRSRDVILDTFAIPDNIAVPL